jgi:hypothetical protein
MSEIERELLAVTQRLLDAIHAGDVETYASLCVADLSCYETDVAPYRIDNLEFHTDLIRAMGGRADQYANLVRCDMLTPRVQHFGNCGVVTYTRLMTWMRGERPEWTAFNESRVFVRLDSVWKMVHFHRSHAAL